MPAFLRGLLAVAPLGFREPARWFSVAAPQFSLHSGRGGESPSTFLLASVQGAGVSLRVGSGISSWSRPPFSEAYRCLRRPFAKCLLSPPLNQVAHLSGVASYDFSGLLICIYFSREMSRSGWIHLRNQQEVRPCGGGGVGDFPKPTTESKINQN